VDETGGACGDKKRVTLVEVRRDYSENVSMDGKIIIKWISWKSDLGFGLNLSGSD
jgi:hypothetical protein